MYLHAHLRIPNSAIYRKCFTRHCCTRRPSQRRNAQRFKLNMLTVKQQPKKQLLVEKEFRPPQLTFLRKGAWCCVFLDTYLHWAAYRHNETCRFCYVRWLSVEITTCFRRQNVWRRGRRRNSEDKKWCAGLQRWNIVTTLALCKQGLSEFSVASWRLKQAHVLL